MVVTITGLTDWGQRIGLIHKEDTAHSLVAEPIYHLGGFPLIGTDHLGTVHLYHMSTIQITDRREYLTQLSCYGRFTSTRISCQYDVHRHLLLLSQPALSTLKTVLYGIGYFADSTLHLVHTNKMVKVFKDVVNRAFLRHIALDVALLDNRCRSPAADKLREDILGSLQSQMAIAESLVFYLYLVFEIAFQLIIGLRGEV